MEKLIRFSALAALTVMLIGVAFFGGWGTSWAIQHFGTPAPDPTGLVASAEPLALPGDEVNLAVFWEALGLLNTHYYGELPAQEELTYAAIRGVVEATGDQHTAFANPVQAKLFEQDLQGEFEGIGATVRLEEGEVTIVAPMSGSPAARAGILPNDIIVAVDQQDLQGKNLQEAIALIRGPRGTTVHLTIRRAAQRDLLEFAVTRDRIVMVAVESRIISDPNQPPIGYISLNDFGARAPQQLRETLQALQDQGMTTLILDVRGNPGGYLTSAIEITSEFVGEGVIVSEKGSQGRDEQHLAESGGVALDIPLVILVDEGSASASEILAGAVQDTKRGTLIGTTTFGKGSVQGTHTLSDGSNLRVTIARWFTPNGRAIHETGIQPDITIERTPADLQAGRDPQLERAIQFIREGK
jgi:carboxyl-terminal processing protease